MNNENLKPVEKLSPFTKVVMSIGTLPSSFYSSMTYYESMVWLYEYMKNTVIPTINENAEAVEELQALFIQLKEYIDTYFDNLDVQEEINKKLDEMAEDGTLADIIADYIKLKGQLVYNNVSEMKLAENLYNGSFAKTYGFTSYDDKGGALYKVRTITNDDIIDEITIIALADDSLIAELIPEPILNVKQFGAKGDGTTDDTTSIQKAVDYCYANNCKLIINGTSSFYKTTLPIIINITRGAGGYWEGTGNAIEGENKDICRITKIGDAVYTNHSNPNINNVNATFICANTNTAIEKGTGIYLNELTLENYTNTSFDKTVDSLGLFTNVPRSTYKNLNVNAYKGINATGCFSCLFENLVFNVVEKAFYLTGGTSNTFRFMYAPACTDPYTITSNYSTLLNVCCDSGKGTIFEIAGVGLTLISCGTESRNAKYIFKIINNWTVLKIENFYMHRQIGDVETSLSVDDCAVLQCDYQATIDIENITVVEFDAIDTANHNSSFFHVNGVGAVMVATNLKNLRYIKNYSGDANARMKLWGGRPHGQSIQRYSNTTLDFNYVVTSNLEIYPYIGGYYGTSLTADSQGNCINPVDISASKTIWLDCKDKYHNEKNTDVRYISQHHKGDVQLFNDPKSMNALGLAITNEVNTYTWDTAEIPINLVGTTEERPTTNLYVGLRYFDTTLGKPIWRTSSAWVDATGTSV